MSEAAGRLGWDEAVTDWRELVARDDIDLIDICTPGDSHAEIAIAALAAGKHVLCEKPLANTVAEAEAMVGRGRGGPDSRRAGDVRLQLPPGPGRLAHGGSSSRRAGSARSGTSAPSTCRTGSPIRSSRWSGGCRRNRAGSGALGDIGAHIIDLTQFVTGQRITGVSALTETFVTERPLPTDVERPGGVGRQRRRAAGQVTVDDAALFLARLVRRRGGHVRGDPLRHRPQERPAGRDQRLAGLAGVRPGAPQRAGVLRRHPAGRPSRASAASW